MPIASKFEKADQDAIVHIRQKLNLLEIGNQTATDQKMHETVTIMYYNIYTSNKQTRYKHYM